MGVLDALISSLPSAPGTGFGPAVAAGGSAIAGAGGAPPGCGMGGPGSTDPGDEGSPPDTPDPDGPDHTPSPEPYTPAHPPMSWDRVTGGETGTSSDGAAPVPSGAEGSSGDRFFGPREGGRSYGTVKALDRYGDWLREGSPGTRAAKALTGLVVIPLGAVLTCAENTIRSPFPG